MEQENSVQFHRFLDKATRFVRNYAATDVEDSGFKHYHIPFLVAIARTPGVSQKGLCEKVPLDKSRVSIVVRELIGLGLAVNTSTGTVWSLSLTPAGIEAYNKSMDTTNRIDEAIFSAVSADEMESFLDTAQKLSLHIDKISDEYAEGIDMS